MRNWKWAQKLRNTAAKKKSFIYYFGYKQSVKNLLSFKMFRVKVANNCEQIQTSCYGEEGADETDAQELGWVRSGGEAKQRW